MQNLTTLVLILTPLLIGFALPKSQKLTHLADDIIRYLVIIILTYIGIELSQVSGLLNQIDEIFKHVTLLAFLTISFGIVALWLFDKFLPWHAAATKTTEQHKVKIRGSLLQVFCVVIGFIIGHFIPHEYLPPDFTMTALLMILILIVGVGLKGSGITLKEVLINKRGVQISIIFTGVVLSAGVVYSLIMPEVSLFKGLALSSGFGWYSLSAVVMTDNYGAVWGTIALLNDLIREFFSLIFIPFIMRHSISAGVSVGGATSLDFTLPVIQQSGGLAVIPMTISFGFIINIISPILMVLFASFG